MPNATNSHTPPNTPRLPAQLFSDTPSPEALIGGVLAFMFLRLPHELVAVVSVKQEPGYVLANEHMNEVLELSVLTWFCLACQGDNRRTSSRQLRRNGRLCRPTTAHLLESRRQGRQLPKS
jgi:hypothetical protein